MEDPETKLQASMSRPCGHLQCGSASSQHFSDMRTNPLMKRVTTGSHHLRKSPPLNRGFWGNILDLNHNTWETSFADNMAVVGNSVLCLTN